MYRNGLKSLENGKDHGKKGGVIVRGCWVCVESKKKQGAIYPGGER